MTWSPTWKVVSTLALPWPNMAGPAYYAIQISDDFVWKWNLSLTVTLFELYGHLEGWDMLYNI